MAYETDISLQDRVAIPDSGVHNAGRYRTKAKPGEWKPVDQGEAGRNFGPERRSFGYDPLLPHAAHMHSKEMVGRSGMLGVLELNQSSAIHVQQFRCAVVRNRNANCLRCADVCTSGCIGIEEGKLTIDASLCVGCGTCATVCPTCALEAHSPTDAELLAACLASAEGSVPKQVAVVCHPLAEALGAALDTDCVAEVVCLGRVDESLIVGLAAQGVQSVDLVCGDCAHCAQKVGVDCARMVADSASELLMAWGCATRARVTDCVPEQVLTNGIDANQAAACVAEYFAVERSNPPIRLTDSSASDGELSARIERQTQPGDGNPECPLLQGRASTRAECAACPAPCERSLAAEPVYSVLKVMKDGTLPHFVPARRERLLDALSSLGAPHDTTIHTRLWGRVEIDKDKCFSCRMCATFCPTGAITKFGEQDSDDFGVEHFPGDCVKCNTCRDICQSEAITIHDDVPASCLLGGEVHRFEMIPRAVTLDGEHQVVNTVRSFIEGDVYER